jgi:hypothetical protein
MSAQSATEPSPPTAGQAEPDRRGRRGREWFVVDREGLAQTLSQRGPAFAVLELIQNAWDELDVTEVAVRLTPVPGRAAAVLEVEDDAAAGFADLSHAWTLWAPSAKKANVAQRGRWNVGEKLVLALCDQAEIVSTTGGVAFGADGRRPLRRRRARGSLFRATIRFTRADIEATAAVVRSLLPPAGIRTTFNGRPIEPRPVVHRFEAVLPTVIADEDGYLRPSRRKTVISLYEPLEGEEASLYELGIPVVATGDRWHLDVAQKVPLNSDRDNVTPGFLRELHTLVYNQTADRLTSDDVDAAWAREVLTDPRITDHAVVRTVSLLFGDQAVAHDPSDPEANKLAVAGGYTVVHGGSLPGPAWRNVRRAGALRPAGQVTPSPKVRTDPEGRPPTPEEKWTPGMRRVAAYAETLAQELLGIPIRVEFQPLVTAYWSAAYGGRVLTFNLGRLGHRWFDEPDQETVDALLLHEFPHEECDDHLSDRYHQAICRLGARLRTAKARL